MSIPGFISALRTVHKAESLDAGQVLELQQGRFRKLLKHAFHQSGFYQDFYRRHGITERDLEAVMPEDLPVIDKNIMMEHYDDFVTDPNLKRDGLERFINEFPSPASKYKGGYAVVHTSGSSGTVGLFAYGAHEWTHGKALALRATGISHPLWRRKRVAFIAATEGHFASVATFYNLPPFLFKRLPLSISSPIEGICAQVNRFQPDVITGYASGLNLLAEQQLAGHIKIAPGEAYCTGDPLTTTFRQRIEKAFGVNPVNIYGSSETMTMACECRQHHRLHLFNDWFSVQVVGKNMEPASSGRVVVTNLYNYTQPLIRYQMNDEIVLSDKPCACGWPFPVIGNLAGRHEEFLWFDQGQGKEDFIHPIVLAEFFVPGLEKFQFVQTSPNSLLMKAVVQGGENEVVAAIRRKMDEILAGKSLAGSVRFEVEVVDGMRNDPKTGKFRLIIPFPSP